MRCACCVQRWLLLCCVGTGGISALPGESVLGWLAVKPLRRAATDCVRPCPTMYRLVLPYRCVYCLQEMQLEPKKEKVLHLPYYAQVGWPGQGALLQTALWQLHTAGQWFTLLKSAVGHSQCCAADGIDSCCAAGRRRSPHRAWEGRPQQSLPIAKCGGSPRPAPCCAVCAAFGTLACGL